MNNKLTRIFNRNRKRGEIENLQKRNVKLEDIKNIIDIKKVKINIRL